MTLHTFQEPRLEQWSPCLWAVSWPMSWVGSGSSTSLASLASSGSSSGSSSSSIRPNSTQESQRWVEQIFQAFVILMSYVYVCRKRSFTWKTSYQSPTWERSFHSRHFWRWSPLFRSWPSSSHISGRTGETTPCSQKFPHTWLIFNTSPSRR